MIPVMAIIGIGVWRSQPKVAPQGPWHFVGSTMGTTYQVSFHGEGARHAAGIEAEIAERLEGVNRSMSTWDAHSEISRINQGPAKQWLAISTEFEKVLTEAQRISGLTAGAFDVTAGPIVNLWGFGPTGDQALPTVEARKAALATVGYQQIEQRPGALRKRLAGIALDFSAIAKGYGVDQIAELLEARAIANYMVEIGGEIRVKGLSPRGEPWVVGIEDPRRGMLDRAPIRTLAMRHGAAATSGSYRNFREDGGMQRSHIVDPRTGEAITSAFVSVTVLAPTCMTADAVATALMVMGADVGKAWVESQGGIEAMFLVETEGGELAVVATAGF